MKDQFQHRFVEAMHIRGMRQVDVAEKSGLDKAQISQYKNGKYEPMQDALYKLAKALDVNVAWLMGYDVPMEMNHFELNQKFMAYELGSDVFRISKGIKVPVVGEVAAGHPIFAEENYIGSEDVSEELCQSGQVFGLKIKGDSMSPRIAEGDTVIVRQQDDAESGDIVIVLVNGDTATCKRLMKYAEGISLISFNPAYEPMYFSNKDIVEKPVRIIGKVIENRQKY